MGWKEVEGAKRKIKSHTRFLTKMFSMGEDWGESNCQRVSRAMNETSSIIPQTSLTQKDHKPPGLLGVPKVRLLCNASSTTNQHISDLLTDIPLIRKVVKSSPLRTCSAMWSPSMSPSGRARCKGGSSLGP